MGERDDTIPPEYRHLLDKDKGKPMPPPTEKPKKSKVNTIVVCFYKDFLILAATLTI